MEKSDMQLCRYLHLEVCIGSLDSYIQEDARDFNFPWITLPELCCQLVDSVIWLHHGAVYFDGELNPRNILVKPSGAGSSYRKIVKLIVPDKLNPFKCLDQMYAKLWTGFEKSDLNHQENLIQKDIASVAILIYFIQSCGSHPFQSGREFTRKNYEAIYSNILEEQWDVNDKEALDKTCFCLSEINNADSGNVCNRVECKYHAWINILAKDWCDNLLMELAEKIILHSSSQSLEKLKDHPFFWNNSNILSFIQRSSNYLNEKNDDKERKRKFGWVSKDDDEKKAGTKKQPRKKIGRHKAGERINSINEALNVKDYMSCLKKAHPNIVGYLHEFHGYKPPGGIENFFWLLIQIRHKVSII